MTTPIELNDDNFDAEVVESDTPVLVDFHAPWCGHCKQQAPIVHKIAEEQAGKLKVGSFDVNDNTQVPARFGVMSIPKLLLVKDGDVVWEATGFTPKDKIESAIEENA